MTELKRWLDDAPSDDIRELLAAARDEDAPARLLRRTLVALGTTSATAAGASAASAPSGVSATSSVSATSGAAKLGMLGVVLKWGGAGLVSGTLVGGAVAGVTRMAAIHDTSRAPAHFAQARPAPPATNPSPDLPRKSAVLATDDTKAKTNGVTLTNPVTPTNGALGSPGSPPTPNTAKPPSVAITPLNTASTTTTARPSAPGAVPEPPDSRAATAREVALVDAARAALRRGDGGGTLRLLGDYERLFHPAHLEPEVLYLRMQAAQQQGDRAGARRAATQILTEFPQSPEVGRAEELLQAETRSVKK